MPPRSNLDLLTPFSSRSLLISRSRTIDSLLSTELIASIIICGAFFMAIRTILGFTRTVSELRPKLSQIENTLNRVREGMKENKELVDNLSTEVTPIRDLEGKMRGHYEDMQELQLNEEKKKLAEEEAETGRKRRIQRKKMGFGESETEELA